MIALKQFTEIFQNGLNAVLNNNEIQFKIWSDVGKYQKALREGNTITKYINGNLRISTSANDANDLVMGINGLTLDFMVPIKPPRTNTKQTTAELSEIQNGQYQFVDEIVNAINAYFQQAVTITMDDNEGNTYAVSYQAGTAVSGTVELLPIVGKALEVSVYIEVYFIEGGVNSKSVKVYVDDVSIPYTAARLGRSPVIERDVYSENLVSKSIITSTAIAIDLDFPSTVKGSAGIALDYLFDGEPNVAHFVKVEWGTVKENYYFMTINTAINSAQGITIAGASISLVEVGNNIFNVPNGYQVRKFIFNSSEQTNLTFELSTACYIFIAGKALKTTGAPISIELDNQSFIYDEEKDEYGVYLITNKPVSVISASAPYIGVHNVTAVRKTWVWNDNINPSTKSVIGTVNFISQNKNFVSLAYGRKGPFAPFYIEYKDSSGVTQRACDVANGVTTWTNEALKTIDFGNSEQPVVNDFYQFLTANAKKVD